MKASSKTALVVLAAILILLAGTVWRLLDTSRPTAREEPGSVRFAADRDVNRPSGKGASSISRPRGVGIEIATPSSPDAAAAGAQTVQGVDEPEVRVRGQILDRLGRPVAGAVVVARADLRPGMSTNASQAHSDGAGRYVNPSQCQTVDAPSSDEWCG
jgi:hypothetical protein